MPQTGASISKRDGMMVTSESFLLFANSLPEPMMLISGGGFVLAVNRAGEQQFGVSLQEWRGRRLADVVLDPPNEIEHYLFLCSRSRQTVLGAVTIRGRDQIACRVEGSLVSPRTDGSDAVILVRLIPQHAAATQFMDLNLRIEELGREVHRRKRAEQDARESAERLRTTLASIGDGVISTDISGRITNMNPVAELLTGWTNDEAIGVPLTQVFNTVNETTRQPVENLAERALQEGLIVELANHSVLIAKDGTERPVDDSAAPIRAADGRIVGSVLVFRDVTERRSLERQLVERLQSAQLLSAIVNSSVDAIISTSVEGIIQSWNAGAERLFGYTAAEAVGRHISFVIPTERISEEDEILSLIRAGRRVEHMDTVRVRRDGQFIHVSLSVSPVRDDEGRVVGASKIVRDVTERKQAEEQIRTSEARLRSILEHSPVGIVQTDASFRLTLVNRRWCEMLGYSEAELLEKRVVDITHSSSIAATHEAVGRLAEGGPDFQIQKSYKRKDGSVLSALSNVTAVRSPEGQFQGMIAVVLDTTELLRIEGELRRVAAELSAADGRKNEFLATLAHELRNPLAPIRNGLQLMRLAGDDRAVVDQARDMIDRQVNQIVRLVDDLMDVNRIATGKVELRKERVSLASVVESAIETSRPLIELMGHDLKVALPEHPLIVEVDPTRLAQALLNLLNNAAKYSEPNSRIWLTAEQQGTDVVVSVRDTGIGIPADQLSRVFEMFSQADRSLEKSRGGLGIGLCLVKRLVELHGGTIEAQSEGPGKGSEFVVRLPVVVDSAASAEEANVPEEHDEPLRILIVDDNHDSADSLAMMLKMMGNESSTAYDGEEAVAVACTFRPDVILLDIGLPKLNGHEVCRRIRQLDQGKEMVIIAQTGWGQHEDRRRTLEAGFDHHLVKPVDLQALMTLLRSLSKHDDRQLATPRLTRFATAFTGGAS